MSEEQTPPATPEPAAQAAPPAAPPPQTQAAPAVQAAPPAPRPPEFSHFCLVRYGNYHFRGKFGTNDATLRPGEHVIVRSPRDLETGTILAKSLPLTEDVGIAGPVLRRMTAKDRTKALEFEERSRTQLWKFVEEKAAELKLTLHLVNVEALFGEQKVVVHYTANGRIDFRELVHVLARRFHARIEMRQIGPRDCTRIHGGIGTCGLALCCATYLDAIEAVTIRMAKEQGQPLNPGKNCGACGKLKCCLRYELEAETLETLKRTKKSNRP
jgi:cell fate regulator YaaT (PSP1 superfamily)